MKIVELYNDFSVPYRLDGHKHCREGWVQVSCPFCTGNPGYHLGFNLTENYYYCWRCGHKHADKALQQLLKLPVYKVREIIIQYGGIKKRGLGQTEEKKVHVKINTLKFPTPLLPLQQAHHMYLQRRGFNSEKIEKIWELKATGPVGVLKTKDKTLNYRFRVIAPIRWNGQIVSYQGRDITNRHPLKYMACPKEREVIHHKDILYGIQEKWTATGICVEGITDVWRFFPHAFCTFGLEYTSKQLRVMAQTFKRIPVIFDGGEPQSIKKANQLVADLKFRGVDSFRVDIEGDPGAMSQKEANYLIQQLI